MRLGLSGLAVAAGLATASMTQLDCDARRPAGARGAAEVAAAAAADRAEVVRVLTAMERFGEKRVGTQRGRDAGKWLRDEMETTGVDDVRVESFRFPRHDVESSALSVVIDGAPFTVRHEVFEGSGDTAALASAISALVARAARADASPEEKSRAAKLAARVAIQGDTVTADVVDVNIGTPADLEGRDLVGRFALLHRDANVDRAGQLQNVVGAGAIGMLYTSTAPDDPARQNDEEGLIQIGTVRSTFEAIEKIPAITMGAKTGARIRQAIAEGRGGRATLRLRAATTPIDAPGEGHNIVARLVGEDDTKYVIVGAHYDTWFVGACDNSSGTAGTVAIAAHLAREFGAASGKRLPYSVVFVLYDGEEVDLYGGYHYLRQHYFRDHDDILAVLNLEMPSGLAPAEQARFPEDARATWELDYSNIPILADTFDHGGAGQTGLAALYPVRRSMGAVNADWGGYISTDIQGHYRAGLPTVMTNINTPYYHTTADTKEHLDIEALAGAVDAFAQATVRIMGNPLDVGDPAAEFKKRDAAVWRAELDIARRASKNDDLHVSGRVLDAAGAPRAGVPVQVEMHVSDFFQAYTNFALTTDDRGRVAFDVPASAVNMAPDGRWIHLTSGDRFPLVETIASVEGP
jgi:hypothetical protein